MPTGRAPAALPHAYPFLMLDAVAAIEPLRSATAIKNVTRGEPWLSADGSLSPVLLLEAIAQCAGVAAAGIRPGSGAMLARIDRFRSARRGVRAGDQLEVRARIVRVFGATVMARGVVRVAGRVRAAAEIVLQLTPAGILEEGQGARR
jgi:3-hydroxyacyl-[acyl-carrier-protein] dehydratase/UDP-3-O-[3-hydroxymyristoyl] N-acetylglucosamine deacetylase/3-hydroxyacyl-[acyl-carrier-protein] dehydratase